MTTDVCDFPPNWDASVTISYEFKTSFPTLSRRGNEQRIALRTSPRRSVEQKCLVAGAAFRRFKRLLLKSGQSLVRFYDPTRYIYLTASPQVSGGPLGLLLVLTHSVASTIEVGVVPSWLIDGMDVALVWNGDIEFYTVSDVTQTSIILAGNDRPWPVGTRIFPVCQGYLRQDMTSSRRTNDVSEVTLAYDVLPGSEAFDPGASGNVFNGREVLLVRPNWASEPSVTISTPSETIDYGRGVIAKFYPIKFPTGLVSQTFLLRDGTAAKAMVDFFGRMKGQQGEFYAPSWEDDFPLVEPTTGGGSLLIAQGTEPAEIYEDDTVHKALAVFFRDGRAPVFRLVTAIVGTSDGNSAVTVDKPWVAGFSPAEVLHVSWLLVYRHATDTMQIEWLSDGTAQTKLSIKTLEDLPPEKSSDIAGHALGLLLTLTHE